MQLTASALLDLPYGKRRHGFGLGWVDGEVIVVEVGHASWVVPRSEEGGTSSFWAEGEEERYENGCYLRESHGVLGVWIIDQFFCRVQIK